MSDRQPVARARHTETKQKFDVVLREGCLVAEHVDGDPEAPSFVDESRIPIDLDVTGPWQHFKGPVYDFKGVAEGPDGEGMALYRDTSGSAWLRPWEMVTEVIDRDGYRGPRFVRKQVG